MSKKRKPNFGEIRRERERAEARARKAAEETTAENDPDWLNRLFDLLNRRHFDGKLPTPRINVQRWQGHFAAYVPQVRIIWIDPRVAEQDLKFVSDSLLHEMVHLALDVETADHDQEHGERFVARVNEIGAQLGLRALRVGEEEVIEWPQSLRPVGYSPWRGPEDAIRRAAPEPRK